MRAFSIELCRVTRVRDSTRLTFCNRFEARNSCTLFFIYLHASSPEILHVYRCRACDFLSERGQESAHCRSNIRGGLFGHIMCRLLKDNDFLIDFNLRCKRVFSIHQRRLIRSVLEVVLKIRLKKFYEK